MLWRKRECISIHASFLSSCSNTQKVIYRLLNGPFYLLTSAPWPKKDTTGYFKLHNITTNRGYFSLLEANGIADLSEVSWNRFVKLNHILSFSRCSQGRSRLHLFPLDALQEVVAKKSFMAAN